MNDLSGKTVTTISGKGCQVKRLLGSGGQGEVYAAEVDGTTYALKVYFAQNATPEQYATLENLVRKGAPNSKFLWPLELVKVENEARFGYLMGLREERFKGLVDLMKRRVEPSFRALCTAGYELADSYLQLHSKGLCYRDISFGNVFLDPDSGEVRICDNDNVGIDGESEGGVLGTPRFMAPEIVRGESKPSSYTDLYSLAMLLFYMFMLGHPLEGKREAEIRCLDLLAMNKLYGGETPFIFDPQDDSNRPVPGYHDNVILYWKIYPQFLRDLFTRAFTDGMRDPKNGRVRESEWRQAFIRLRDAIMYCTNCGAENFYDSEAVKTGKLPLCWSCNRRFPLPMRLRIDGNVVMLNHDTRLYPHHIGQLNDFSTPIAEVTQNPNNPSVWGLRNVSAQRWTAAGSDGQIKEIPSGKSITLRDGMKINFGGHEGEIRQ